MVLNVQFEYTYIIVWGIPKDLPTLEIRAKFVNLGLVRFARGNLFWDEKHDNLV